MATETGARADSPATALARLLITRRDPPFDLDPEDVDPDGPVQPPWGPLVHAPPRALPVGWVERPDCARDRTRFVHVATGTEADAPHQPPAAGLPLFVCRADHDPIHVSPAVESPADGRAGDVRVAESKASASNCGPISPPRVGQIGSQPALETPVQPRSNISGPLPEGGSVPNIVVPMVTCDPGLPTGCRLPNPNCIAVPVRAASLASQSSGAASSGSVARQSSRNPPTTATPKLCVRAEFECACEDPPQPVPADTTSPLRARRPPAARADDHHLSDDGTVVSGARSGTPDAASPPSNGAPSSHPSASTAVHSPTLCTTPCAAAHMPRSHLSPTVSPCSPTISYVGFQNALSPGRRAPPPPPSVPLTLPPGWEQAIDEDSGRTYYIHVPSGHVQWLLPSVMSSSSPMNSPPMPTAAGPSAAPATSLGSSGATGTSDDVIYVNGDSQNALAPTPSASSPGALDGQVPQGAYDVDANTTFAFSRRQARSCSASEAATRMGCTRGHSAQLSLELSAANLRNPRNVGICDPVAIVEMQDDCGRWTRIGQTEIVENTRNPHWNRHVSVDLRMAKLQLLRFIVYDATAVSRDRRRVVKKKFLGQLVIPLSSIVATGSAMHDLTNIRGDDRTGNRGNLCVRVHESGGASTYHKVRVTCQATNLDRVDLCGLGKADPYLTVFHVHGAGPATLLCRTAVVYANLNPNWGEMVFNVDARGLPPEGVRLRIVVTDWNEKSKHKPLGEVDLTLANLVSSNPASFPIINEAHPRFGRGDYKNSGTLIVSGQRAVEIPSHVAYIRGGCTIKVMVAIDMTAETGSAGGIDSVHRRMDGHPSLTSRALQAVGGAIAPYLKKDQIIMAYGFGASHAGLRRDMEQVFPLNPNAFGSNDARVVGIGGLVAAYEACAAQVQNGSTACLQHIVSRAIDIASSPPQNEHSQQYSILVVLSSGRCSDMDDTIKRICYACHRSPLSIVIVGVGKDRDWSEMRRLDGDDKLPKTSDGKFKATRDIVQFMEYDASMSAEEFAAHVLAEVPTTLREYYAMRGIRPMRASASEWNPAGPGVG